MEAFFETNATLASKLTLFTLRYETVLALNMTSVGANGMLKMSPDVIHTAANTQDGITIMILLPQ